MRSRSSEFPNDNGALHRGAVWVSSEPCAPYEAELAARTPGPPPVFEPVADLPDEPVWSLDEDPGDDIEVVDELEPLELDLPSRPSDPFDAFLATLVEVATEAGCERAAAILPALLEGGQVLPGVLPDAITATLLEKGVLARSDDGLVGGQGLQATAAAWRAILSGTSEDFSSCGTRMLDEWAADLVACLVAAPARTEPLRRQLRTRGVAAFGLVQAA